MAEVAQDIQARKGWMILSGAIAANIVLCGVLVWLFNLTFDQPSELEVADGRVHRDARANGNCVLARDDDANGNTVAGGDGYTAFAHALADLDACAHASRNF